MATLYAMRGAITGELLSYGGQVLTHDNEVEMAFLFQGVHVERLRRDDVPTLSIRFHPDLAHLSWPLRREEFAR